MTGNELAAIIIIASQIFSTLAILSIHNLLKRHTEKGKV
jgi:hypothetical protein